MNIWEKYNFNNEPDKVLTFLRSQEEGLKNKSKGILLQHTEVIYSDYDYIVYNVYIVSPKLANYRRKLFHIVYTNEKYDLLKYDESIYVENSSVEEIIEHIRDYVKTKEVNCIVSNLYRQSTTV